LTRLTATASYVAGLAEKQIDDVLSSSFPASDPPSWTFGRDRRAPADARQEPGAFVRPVRAEDHGVRSGEGATVSTARSFIGAAASLLGAIGLTLLVPMFVVLLPLALLYRFVLEVTGWPDLLPRIGHRPAWAVNATRSERRIVADTSRRVRPWPKYS
jgi:hypothetical protein